MLYPPNSWLKCHWAAQLSGVISRPSGLLSQRHSSRWYWKRFYVPYGVSDYLNIIVTFLLMDNHYDLAYKTLSKQHENYLVILDLKFFCAVNLRPWWYLFITFLMIYQVTIAILVPWKLLSCNTHLLYAILTAWSYCLSCLISSRNLKLFQNVNQ